MQLHVLRAESRFGACGDARGELLERKLRSFRPEVQVAVRRLARRHSRLADLAVSFPALLVALAVPRAGFDPEPVIALVIGGARLAELAKAADVALWLRKFAPPLLPCALPKLPDSHDFRRQIVNHLPHTPKLAPVWLSTVANAAAWGDETLAIWVARHFLRDPKHDAIRRLRLISLWAWFSARPETLAHRFVETPFTPSMQFGAALSAAGNWKEAVSLYLDIGEETVADMWIQPAIVDGYEFVPLRSFLELSEEARAMRNCVRTYGYNVKHNRSRLWSMRKDGQRVATLEIANHGGDPFPYLGDLRSVGNKDAPLEAWWAARRWLHMHDLRQLNTNRLEWDAVPLNRARWMAQWKPYWLAKRRFPEWLPLAPSPYALEVL
jgi:hypothetical protein